MALVEVIDTTEDAVYDALVVDTAPTGHFLRLLELPDVVLEWTHQAMRLLLKYREVVAPGELGERLLKLSRTLRSFRTRLRDPVRTWMLVVTLPESLSAPETTRLLARLRELEIAPGALLLNRALRNGVISALVEKRTITPRVHPSPIARQLTCHSRSASRITQPFLIAIPAARSSGTNGVSTPKS